MKALKQWKMQNKQLINDEKIAKLMQDLSKDTYNFTYTSLTTKNDKKLNYAFSYKLDNNKENVISTNLKGSFKEEIFTLLDNLNVKFDTNQLAVNLINFRLKNLKKISIIILKFLKQGTLKNLTLISIFKQIMPLALTSIWQKPPRGTSKSKL